MKRFAALLTAALLVAPIAAQQPSAQVYSDRLAKLSDIQRKAAIRNAIIENKQWCRRVEQLAYQGPYKNLVIWVARCGPKPLVDYGVFLGPDGTVQVSTCPDLVRVKWPACRKLP